MKREPIQQRSCRSMERGSGGATMSCLDYIAKFHDVCGKWHSADLGTMSDDYVRALAAEKIKRGFIVTDADVENAIRGLHQFQIEKPVLVESLDYLEYIHNLEPYRREALETMISEAGTQERLNYSRLRIHAIACELESVPIQVKMVCAAPAGR